MFPDVVTIIQAQQASHLKAELGDAKWEQLSRGL